MKRILATIVGVMACLSFMCHPALAETITSDKEWTVTYTAEGKMEDNYSAEEYIDQVSKLQPGDTIIFSVNCKHQNSQSADWYMQNEVFKTLEEQSPVMEAKYGAYTYKLRYESTDTGVSKILYDSNTVGGDVADGGEEGLAEATSALSPSDYIYLDRLSKGNTAKVTLEVGLDGETEGNAYFDTLAKLKIRFAVEPVTADSSTTTDDGKPSTTPSDSRTWVKTGDDTNLFPFYVAMCVSGTLLLILFIVGVRERRKETQK